MYDTVLMKLYDYQANGVSFVEETPCYLYNVIEHYYNDIPEPTFSGWLNGLKISVSRTSVKVITGSLCKFQHGSNLHTMGRRDTQEAIEKLSDLLHLPMGNAEVTRIDVGQNLILKYPPPVYFNHLGQMPYAVRLPQETGLYYKNSSGQLVFYDKMREQKAHSETITELYDGNNVLRYERRWMHRVSRTFNMELIEARHLYDEAFYMKAVDKWRADYHAIDKINEVRINFEAMKTIQQMNMMGRLALVEKAGGMNEMISQIREAQQRGELTRKQAYDLKAAIYDACEKGGCLNAPDEAIQELTKKIDKAARYYR